MLTYDATYRLPARAQFDTVPQAIDSAARQKLSDYVAHMAADAQVSVSALVNAFVDWPATPTWKKRPFASGQRLGYVNGGGRTANAWILYLQPLVARRDLEQLTLLPIKRAVGNITGWLADSRRWCPKCLHEDLEQGTRIYERLIWSIGLVKACPVHHLELTDTCPHCGFKHRHELDRHRVSGFCSRCRAWLGACTDTCEASQVSQYDKWISENFSAVLALQADGLSELSPSNWPTMIEAGIDVITHGKALTFGKLCATQNGNISDWRHRKCFPSIRALLRISWVFGIPLVDLMRGRQDAWARAMLRTLPAEIVSKVSRTSHVNTDWTRIEKALSSYASGERPCGSMREVARKLEVGRSSLHRRFPELVRQIARLGRQERLEAAVAREIARRERISTCALRVVQTLLEQHTYPSWRRIEAALRDQYRLIITHRDNVLVRSAQIQGGVVPKRAGRSR
ncbi:TniQ family protein [Burkholderia ubonensis]|uniref:TniQ family protein n=1 Tax=Burkholderia ubonensis TaxID=101571 RepID=UPI0009B46934|nr:TniQ family protein [Burkholderia ubonensis]